MKNGDAFAALTEEAVDFLKEKKALDYYREPLPSTTDEKMAAMIGRFMDATPAQREAFQQALTSEQRALFGIYGHRAATLSVRENARDRLLSGLVGAAIANYVVPARRNVDVALAVYHHCARKLGVNTVDLFEEAAGYAGEEIAGHLAAFGRRSDVHLKSYGWRELRTPEGVQYRFEWK